MSPAAAASSAEQSLGTDVSSMLARARALAGGQLVTATDEPQSTLTTRGATRPVSRPAHPCLRRDGLLPP